MQHPASTKNDPVPKNYYCSFDFELNKTIDWQLEVYRYISTLTTETIEIIEVNSRGQETTHDDAKLRTRSYTSYDKNGNLNKTSEANIVLKSSTQRIQVKVSNNFLITGSSFRIWLVPDPNSGSWSTNLITLGISIAGALLVFCVVAQCIRCYVNR